MQNKDECQRSYSMSEPTDEEQLRGMMIKEFQKYAQRQEVYIAPAKGF